MLKWITDAWAKMPWVAKDAPTAPAASTAPAAPTAPAASAGATPSAPIKVTVVPFVRGSR